MFIYLKIYITIESVIYFYSLQIRNEEGEQELSGLLMGKNIKVKPITYSFIFY